MRATISYLVLLSAGTLAFTACADANKPLEPKPAAPTAAGAIKNPPSDGFIVVLKEGRSGVNRARPGARLGSIIALPASSAGNDATVTDIVPSINGVVVRGVANASDIAGDEVAAVIPNYVADVIDPLTADPSLLATADPFTEPTGTDQHSSTFFLNNTQWGYKKISVDRVWVPSRGGAGAKVCITDSGIDAGHGSFNTKVIQSSSFITNSSPQTDTVGHGSHVAGTISTNGFGAASVAPDATLMTSKIFNGAGGGATTSVVLNAVAWCADNGADVINMSIGFTGGVPLAGNAAFIAAYQTGLDYATNLGVLIVASAGNDATTLPAAGLIFLPAEAAGVTSVAATSPTANLSPFGSATWVTPGAPFDGIASYSNRGVASSVDLSAPGGDRPVAAWPVQSLILSVCSRQFNVACAGGTTFLYNAGTSMASPHVAGVAALIRARWPSTPRSPALRNKIEACLYKSVDNIGSTSIFGRGRVNAYKATTQPC